MPKLSDLGLRVGDRIRRVSWNNSHMFLEVIIPGHLTNILERNKDILYSLTIADIAASDWILYRKDPSPSELIRGDYIKRGTKFYVEVDGPPPNIGGYYEIVPVS